MTLTDETINKGLAYDGFTYLKPEIHSVTRDQN